MSSNSLPKPLRPPIEQPTTVKKSSNSSQPQANHPRHRHQPSHSRPQSRSSLDDIFRPANSQPPPTEISSATAIPHAAAAAAADADAESAYNSKFSGSNALILPSKAESQKVSAPPVPLPKPVSKSVQLKLARLAAVKAKKLAREQYFKQLADNKLTIQQKKLLHSSTEINSKETLKQKLVREFRLEKAGISTGENKRKLTKQVDNQSLFENHKSKKIKAPAPIPDVKLDSEGRPIMFDGFGLAVGRWRNESAPIGEIERSTDRVIQYGSEEEEESEEENESADSNSDGDAADSSSYSDVLDGMDDYRPDKAASDSDSVDSSAGFVDGSGHQAPVIGPFSVQFKVIKTSNRKTKKRKVIQLPGQPMPETEKIDSEQESENEDEMREQTILNSSVKEENDEENDDEEETNENSIENPDAASSSASDADSAAESADDSAASADDSPADEIISRDAANDDLLDDYQSALDESNSDVDEPKRKKFSALAVNPNKEPRLKENERLIPNQRQFIQSMPAAERNYKPNNEKIDDPLTSNQQFADKETDRTALAEDAKADKSLKGQAIADQSQEEWDSDPTLVTRADGKTFVVYVNRNPAMQHQRLALPICGQESEIIELIQSNDFLIVTGATGSGKSTQIPQFLLESGFSFSGRYPGIIGITEPRRVAAVSTAKRVADELNLPSERPVKQKKEKKETKKKPYYGTGVCTEFDPIKAVGYQIRYDKSNCTDNTRIKFMTDGILLREIQSDFLLRKYSVICCDECHERGVNTDILIGLLSRIVPLRNKKARECGDNSITPLKVILMSATLRVDDFQSNAALFPTPPVLIDVPARQFPVTIHFNKTTPIHNYLQETLKKLCRMHSNLPRGGILVFLTGKDEIEWMVQKLNAIFNKKKKKKKLTENRRENKEEITEETNHQSELYDLDETSEVDDEKEFDEEIDGGDFDVDAEATLQSANVKSLGSSASQSLDEEKLLADLIEDEQNSSSKKVRALPLYSILSTAEQMKVFEPNEDEENQRHIILSTNIAETSLTMPNIRFVLDTGREKVKKFNELTGSSKFEVEWISQASANQRTGRAGRVAPGHSYRMYSGAFFSQMREFAAPEILSSPIDSTLLQMKAMRIPNLAHFPFPTPPEESVRKRALEHLRQLEAIDKQEKITELGFKMSKFPIRPRLARMLCNAPTAILNHIVAIVAAISVEQVFQGIRKEPEAKKEERKIEKRKGEGESDNEASDDSDSSDSLDSNSAAIESDRRGAQQKAFNEAMAKWRLDSNSDLIILMRLIGGFEFDLRTNKISPAEFCKQNFVRLKAVEEIQQLRQQLTKVAIEILKTGEKSAGGILESVEETEEREAKEIAAESVNFAPTNNEPTIAVLRSALQHGMDPIKPHHERLLLQNFLSGFGDRIARRMPVDMKRARSQELFGAEKLSADGIHPNFAGAYQCTETDEPVFIHPESVLFPVDFQPEYLLYTELIQSSGVKNRQFMRVCSTIQSDWLWEFAPGFCKFSAPLDEPPPKYRSEQLKCSVSVQYFGGQNAWRGGANRMWELPKAIIPYPFDATNPTANTEYYRHFTRCLLEGQLFPQFQEFLPFYQFKPQLISRSGELNSMAKYMKIVEPIQAAAITNKAAVAKRWMAEPNFLWKEFICWIPQSKIQFVKDNWPPLEKNQIQETNNSNNADKKSKKRKASNH